MPDLSPARRRAEATKRLACQMERFACDDPDSADCWNHRIDSTTGRVTRCPCATCHPTRPPRPGECPPEGR